MSRRSCGRPNFRIDLLGRSSASTEDGGSLAARPRSSRPVEGSGSQHVDGGPFAGEAAATRFARFETADSESIVICDPMNHEGHQLSVKSAPSVDVARAWRREPAGREDVLTNGFPRSRPDGLRFPAREGRRCESPRRGESKSSCGPNVFRRRTVTAIINAGDCGALIAASCAKLFIG
jgi:hypothetical protein